MNILVTGGTGYIGSHAVQRLLREGHRVLVVDNDFRGHREVIDLLSPTAPGRLSFREVDINNSAVVADAIRYEKIETVMHFAALAYVGESVDDPVRYYHNNVTGLLSLLHAMRDSKVTRLVFSSSCSTYGEVSGDQIPVDEDCPQNPVSPYGRTKLQGEQILLDFAEAQRRAGREFACTFLRYFNVCGCDRSGVLGEDHEPETHLIPVVLRTALGQREYIGIFGTDYDTPDGTCIRDYVHVEDLVDAHVLAMNAMKPGVGAGQVAAYNVGIGRGYSVRQIIESARRVTGREIPVREMPRRAGDPPQVYNNPKKIREALGWEARIPDLDEMIRTAWTWFEKHPNGYRSAVAQR